MTDLESKPLIVLKGCLFFAIVGLSAFAIWWQLPTFTTAALLAVLVWSAARSHYFLFHVLEKYVDPNLRWRGIADLLRAIRRRGGR